jgi:hypothetical protein
MIRSRLRLLTLPAACVLAACLITGAVFAAFQSTPPTQDLAAWAPKDALLSIASPDFSALLHDWTSSPQSAAWLKSDDYAVFSRSKLFTRLQDAQSEFADAAGLPVDTPLIQQLAGRQTFFAWYGIHDLQIVYITRLAPGTAAQNPLLKNRGHFEARQSAGITFYVRTSSATTTATDDTTDTADTADTTSDAATTDPTDATTADAVTGDPTDSAPAETKTVAFAISGDYLILATDEALMAHTLELVAAKPTDDVAATSLAQQPWYTEALAKAPATPGDLRMTLHLETIVKTPQFRSYWVQQNITDIKQFASAVDDLYRDPTGLREERVLLPLPGAASNSPTDTNLAAITSLVPLHTVIYRATAHPSATEAAAAVDDKLINHTLGSDPNTTIAPQADLSTPRAGSAADLDTRIDEPPLTSSAPASSTPASHAGPLPSPLATLLATTPLDAMMTLDRNTSKQTTPNAVFVPFASAVVLRSMQPWNTHDLQTALTQTNAAELTASTLGTAWQPHTVDGTTYFSTSDARPLLFAIIGQTAILADDESFLLDLVQNLQHPSTRPSPEPSLSSAGFDHTAATPAFARWTATIDGLHQLTPTTTPDGTTPSGPAFFSGNIQSLSAAFNAVTTEQIITRRDDTSIRQTVTYTLRK